VEEVDVVAGPAQLGTRELVPARVALDAVDEDDGGARRARGGVAAVLPAVAVAGLVIRHGAAAAPVTRQAAPPCAPPPAPAPPGPRSRRARARPAPAPCRPSRR